MKITSSSELVNKALKEIKTISTEEAHSMVVEGKSNLIVGCIYGCIHPCQ